VTVAEVATLIAAVAAACTSIGAVAVNLINARRIADTHALVNGQSHLVESLAVQVGLKTGELIGRDYVPPTKENV
jgi:hypothetical protein